MSACGTQPDIPTALTNVRYLGSDKTRTNAGNASANDDSLTEAGATLLHIEMKVVLMGFVGVWPEHRPKRVAGIIVNLLHEI